MKFVAHPLTATCKYDEVQMYFYPMNHQSGAACAHTTASFPISVDELQEVMKEKMHKRPSLTINQFLSLIEKKILRNPLNPYYGISQELSKKKELEKLYTKRVAKKTNHNKLACSI